MMIWLKKQSRGSIFFFFKSNFVFSKKMWLRLPSTKWLGESIIGAFWWPPPTASAAA